MNYMKRCVVFNMVSLDRMNKTLLDLFVDRTKIDTSLARFMSKEKIAESLLYSRCMDLNDKDKIRFIESLSHEKHDEKYNMFIPNGDINE